MSNAPGSVRTVPYHHDISKLFSAGSLSLESMGLPNEEYPNSCYVLKAGDQSALVRVSPDGKSLLLVKDDPRVPVKPRNKEQHLLLSTLMDPRIQVQIVSGRAGTGKTLLALAAAMSQIEAGLYEKIILTKPTSEVGKKGIGYLPGTLEEKFAPFLLNYASNVEQLLKVPESKKGFGRKPMQEKTNGLSGAMLDFFTFYRVEMVPIQFLRGASFSKAFIIADEVQVLDHHEMLTLGTRVAGDSKLVLMGDLNQRDEKIGREQTGLHKIMHDERMNRSPLTANIELTKVERGPVAELFTRVFEEAA